MNKPLIKLPPSKHSPKKIYSRETSNLLMSTINFHKMFQFPLKPVRYQVQDTQSARTPLLWFIQGTKQFSMCINPIRKENQLLRLFTKKSVSQAI